MKQNAQKNLKCAVVRKYGVSLLLLDGRYQTFTDLNLEQLWNETISVKPKKVILDCGSLLEVTAEAKPAFQRLVVGFIRSGASVSIAGLTPEIASCLENALLRHCDLFNHLGEAIRSWNENAEREGRYMRLAEIAV